MGKKVSVVMTTYNGQKYLREQMDSLREQTMPIDEVIIMDDCSTDHTPDLVSAYIKEYDLKGWNLVQNEQNQGWKKNFKSGFDLATGNYIFPCDQDDIWHNTNAFAMLFAEKVLTTPGMLDSLITKFNGGRKYLVDSLDKNGYRHKGEAGNFIFIEPKTDAQTVVDRMKAEKKILIKAYPNVGEFGNCLRVSIGEEKYMKQFMDALLEIDQ